MDFTFTIYQREPIQFYLQSDPAVDYSNQLVNIIVKNTDDTLNDNTKAIINKTVALTLANLGQTDFDNTKIGIIKINLDSNETNIDCTDYKVMIQITDNTNTVANILVSGMLKVKDNYLKKV